ncbi:o-succinylbenzoate synthase [Iamia sp. SCSIO 61187]|uniref:enolase C-terminal domain-like protein n=1 Tax=Iamia sp. SCSIO 61187 TaxID=2722752 RepID=UPI001C627E8D|nr:enolase C-terminal domain-like protein [Iamia sp. SCSIO 61187]QYG92791.1 o-succinylbenzoate synthase [Iamia sp. SCSIO 61187]
MSGAPPSDPPTIAAAGVWRVALPLRAAHVAAHGTERDRQVLLVRVVAADGAVGWGECPTLSRPGYTAEWTDGAWDRLRADLLPALLAGEEPGPSAPPMAAGAVRDALLDLALRRERRQPSPSPLGASSTAVPFGVAVGLGDDPGVVVDEVDRAVAAGARLVVLKVRPGWSVVPLAAVRKRRPGVAVAVDANGSFGLDDLDELRAVAAEGPAFVEQPLPAADLAGSARVAAAIGAPVALDEGVATLADLAAAVAARAATMVTVKPARMGGHLVAAEAVAQAHRAGWGVHVGGMLESGLGRAAARRLAARPEVGGPSMVGPTELLFTADVVAPVGVDPEGAVAVPVGPGLAPPPDPDRLAALTVDRWEARP